MSRLVLLLLLSVLSSLSLQAQDAIPTLVLKANTSYRYLDRVDVPLTFGFGLLAFVNDRWSVSGDIGLPSSSDFDFAFVDALVKYHPFERSKLFHLYAGPGFFYVGSADGAEMLGSPFTPGRGDRVGVLKFSFGVGVSTIIKQKVCLGFFLGTAVVGDAYLQSDFLEADLSVGYGF